MSFSTNHPSTSPSPSPLPNPQPIISSTAFRFSADPQFVQAVNTVADLKIRAAIKSGHLRVVRPPPKSYTPRLDIMDDPSSPVVTAILEIPGVPEEDIEIKVLNSSVTISGHRRYKTIASRTRHLCHRGKDNSHFPLPSHKQQEINMGSFHRRLTIPDGLHTSDITATLWCGMLLVSWPRVPHSRRSIQSTNDDRGSDDPPIDAPEDT